ncbi:hypothetical protein FI667_g9678, partial [Globisporangium splendens]
MVCDPVTDAPCESWTDRVAAGYEEMKELFMQYCICYAQTLDEGSFDDDDSDGEDDFEWDLTDGGGQWIDSEYPPIAQFASTVSFKEKPQLSRITPSSESPRLAEALGIFWHEGSQAWRTGVGAKISGSRRFLGTLLQQNELFNILPACTPPPTAPQLCDTAERFSACTQQKAASVIQSAWRCVVAKQEARALRCLWVYEEESQSAMSSIRSQMDLVRQWLLELQTRAIQIIDVDDEWL